ncbi:MAG: PadR family transcriptional regulator [Gemmatimonadota bacterium]
MVAGEIQGEFEHHVLLAALRLEGRAYTSALVVELEERTGREVSPAAVYIALRRLEKKELVRSELRTGEEGGRRRERRFFRVTPAGVTALRESRAKLRRLWEGLDPRLAGGG